VQVFFLRGDHARRYLPCRRLSRNRRNAFESKLKKTMRIAEEKEARLLNRIPEQGLLRAKKK
jgi:hypothetical protein